MAVLRQSRRRRRRGSWPRRWLHSIGRLLRRGPRAEPVRVSPDGRRIWTHQDIARVVTQIAHAVATTPPVRRRFRRRMHRVYDLSGQIAGLPTFAVIFTGYQPAEIDRMSDTPVLILPYLLRPDGDDLTRDLVNDARLAKQLRILLDQTMRQTAAASSVVDAVNAPHTLRTQFHRALDTLLDQLALGSLNADDLHNPEYFVCAACATMPRAFLDALTPSSRSLLAGWLARYWQGHFAPGATQHLDKLIVNKLRAR